ncbi:Nucleotidyltransferase domain-containing protein [Asanoa hainanensis]|uniref:Nucleotidyltransferase domain-containing protein n=1 Tax=Asanoa hainanensis TaxID=560556 RepID=A0A239FPN2_9ACTN|nr:nucleotidyltransferase domain-containing protein [Asanoa hainanensis]SNS58996.1 Nucleotidyltransferase domain-containing protein [Asanoa hainanensis]
MEHHDETLRAYVRRMKADPHAIAVIAVGSVARGTERPDSDVDVYLVVPDDVFDAALAANRVIFVERTDATYPGGYVDVKLATVPFLRAAAERGDDPVRASFEGARVAWARAGHDIAGLVAAIPVLPSAVWESRAVSFISQARLHGTDFLREAVALDNTFLLHHAAVHTVAAGGRALLALNRRLYPGPKDLDATLAALDRVPDGYGDLARRLLKEPSREAADAYVDALEAFHDWPVDRVTSDSIFIRDTELAWFTAARGE